VAGGFSMLELMVVISIAAILIALSATNFMTLRSNSQVESNARTLAKLARDARFRAVAQSCPHGVYVVGKSLDPQYAGFFVFYRKAADHCRDHLNTGDPTTAAFVTGQDRVIDRYPIALRNDDPADPLVAIGGAGPAQAISLTFDQAGQSLAMKNTGSGWTLVAPSTMVVSVTSTVPNIAATRSVQIRGSGVVSFQ
jgi:prepilin-type N-terminal cleavage/methylation domain-containing protein